MSKAVAQSDAKPTAKTKSRGKKKVSVSDEFRQACHLALDTVLDTKPDIDAILIAFSYPAGMNAVSVPPSLPLKIGFITGLFEKLTASGE